MSDDQIFCFVADWQKLDDELTCLAACVVIQGGLVMANGGEPAPWEAFFNRIRLLTEAGITLSPIPGNHALHGGLAAVMD